ncbi:MAG: PASTA domain-containing protein, partial [Actinobacteria bacterium]|nr:PASTA domain-containing protein [Actinomycetota bacterium]
SRRGWWISGIVAAGLLIVGGSAVVLSGAFSSSTSMVVVSDMSGLTVDQARSSMPSLTFVIQHAADPRTPKDRVITSNPPAGTKVESGSKITLTISDGPGDTTVPASLIGKTLEGARQLLLEAGLIIARTNPVNSEQAPGTVLAVSPAGGSTLTAGSGVTLDIASGNVAVPDVLGLSEIAARTILIQAGFLPRIVDAIDPNSASDTVLAQAPEPGITKIVGTSVTITVNRLTSPEPAATP